MCYILNYNDYVKENLFNPYPKHPFFNPTPIKGGVVLLLSTPFPKDNLIRVYANTISKVMKTTETSSQVMLSHNYYILKEYIGDIIMPETLSFTPVDRKRILNMNSDVIWLNNDKTPLWDKSCIHTLRDFFYNYQMIIKNIYNNYENIYFPNTTYKKLPNLQ